MEIVIVQLPGPENVFEIPLKACPTEFSCLYWDFTISEASFHLGTRCPVCSRIPCGSLPAAPNRSFCPHVHPFWIIHSFLRAGL
jgi:hypothetical protein